MFDLLKHHVSDILEKNMKYADGPCILLFDDFSPLSTLLAKAYDSVLPMEAERIAFDPEKQESIAESLFSLPKDSLVILVQSTSFRLSDFRIRLELFHRGIHVLEHNHLAYIPEGQFQTFVNSLEYHTPEYLETAKAFEQAVACGTGWEIVMRSGNRLTFWPLERSRANSGDYCESENKGGTFPIWEIFSECVELESMSGKIDIFWYPDDAFQMVFCDPFEVEIKGWRVVRKSGYPAAFDAILDKIEASEKEVWAREIGIGLNKAITTQSPLSDVNYHERQFGVHFSLGKKHGIYWKKLPKEEVQRYHIDVFLDAESLEMGNFETWF